MNQCAREWEAVPVLLMRNEYFQLDCVYILEQIVVDKPGKYALCGEGEGGGGGGGYLIY